VSQRLGYVPNGTDLLERRGQPATMQRYRLGRDEWATRRRDDIEIIGLTADIAVLLGAPKA
jgi:hypothetical protein